MLPPKFDRYWPVIERFGAWTAQHGSIFIHCPFGSRHKNGVDRHPSAAFKIGDGGKLCVCCFACGAVWKDFYAAARLPVSAWFPEGAMQNQAMPVVKSICVEEYLYHDREGRLVAKKQRWEPGFHGRKKDFTWRRPVPFDLRHQLGIPNADQCWANNLGAGDYLPMRTGEGIILVKKDQPQTGTAFLDGQPMLWLYRLGDLLKSTVQQSVFVVEGERKADRLAALGFVAVSGHAGAGKWEPANAADFKGRKVIIIPDRDGSTGADEYGWRVAGSAMLFGSESVRMVMIEPKELGPNLRGDIVDWLGLHGGRNPRQSVIDLCKRYPEYRGAELPHLKAAA